jgi:hypothetical protein
VKPDDPMLDEIKSYKDFPRSEAWIRRATEKLLRNPAPADTTAAAAAAPPGQGALLKPD